MAEFKSSKPINALEGWMKWYPILHSYPKLSRGINEEIQ